MFAVCCYLLFADCRLSVVVSLLVIRCVLFCGVIDGCVVCCCMLLVVC